MDDELAQSLLNAMTEAVYVVDTDRRISYWNPAAEAITGYRAEDVIGHRCRDGILNHVDDQGRSLCKRACPLLASITQGVHVKARPYLHHRDGHRLPVVVSAAPLRNAAGAIIGAVEVFHDDSPFRSLADQYADAERAAVTDPLTGLGNRRLMESALAHAADDERRHVTRHGLLFADIDHFKLVNDRYGHDAGDLALQAVSATIRSCCRAGDVLARWGGDEFLLLTQASDQASALAHGRRLARLVAAARPRLGDQAVRITMSIGVALMEPGERPEDTVRRADSALRKAKLAGRSRVLFAAT
jgi:diguanylate cyclase (GGDEF)-like protein/PAS domain S-box-containing protein